jgi:hypothetical protein
MFREKHMNRYTIFERAQLFQRFRTFSLRLFPFHKSKQRVSSEAVNSLMPQHFRSARRGPDRTPEIKRGAVSIDNHFDLMR